MIYEQNVFEIVQVYSNSIFYIKKVRKYKVFFDTVYIKAVRINVDVRKGNIYDT